MTDIRANKVLAPRARHARAPKWYRLAMLTTSGGSLVAIVAIIFIR